jgi:oxygen-independent coproporphyrinogen-3 oxidase
MTAYRLTDADRQTYRRYAGLALPRHTSYPSASAWGTDYGPTDFRADLAGIDRQGRGRSVYVHVPFCERLCWYCACTKEIIPAHRRRAHDPGADFLDALEREADHLAAAAGPGAVEQVHLGGGSPTFLHPEQLERLAGILQRRFPAARGAEFSVEIDPRITTREHLETLRRVGCNRVSLGVQDFDLRVQQAVNRVQPFDLVQRCVAWCRELGFASVNFDLLYGLPFQTVESMADTLDRTIELGPDRIAFYRLAVIPEMFRWQNAFRPADLPAGDLPLELNLLAISRFQEAGYLFIGLDHFARPDEALARAWQEGSLRRTFQGMTTGQGLDILALGPSGISQLDGAYAQNCKTTAAWQQAVADDLATERGCRLTADDRLRREVLQQLYGYGIVDGRALEARFGIHFAEYFVQELRHLHELAEEGLVTVAGNEVRLTAPLGPLLVRVVAAVFDRYLPPGAFRAGLAAHQSSRVG